jgi:hypothetical protein
MSNQAMRVLLQLVKAGLAESALPGVTEAELGCTDWNFLLASSRRHRLSGLVYEAARRGNLDSSLPKDTRMALHSDYYTNLALNLVLFDHLEAFIYAARQCGAPVLLLKGAAFVGWIYPNPAVRPMSDLDILIRRQDMDCLVRVAENLGYERFSRSDHALSLRHPVRGTYMELHTSLTSCPQYLGIDTESLMERSTRPALQLEGARTIAPEDHLLHLCLHGSFQHGLRQPAINACDAYLLSHLPELDWEGFLSRVTTSRLAPLVYGGLGLCHRLLPSKKTASALETLEPFVLPRHRRWLGGLEVSRLLSPENESTWGAPWSRILWTTSARDTWQLVRETLQAPESKESPNPWSFFGRGLNLVYRHAVPRWDRTWTETRAGAKMQT